MRRRKAATEERVLGGEAGQVEVEVVEENEWRLVEEACKNAETSRKRKEPSTNEKREAETLSSCSCSSSTIPQPTSVNTSTSTPSLGPRSFSSAIFTPKPPPKLSPSITHFFSPLSSSSSSSPKRQRTPKVIHVLDDPADGVVDYYPSFLSHQEATALFQELHEQCTWKQEEAVLFQKTVKPKRLVSTQGEPGMSYSYAGTTKTVQCGWTELMRRTREKVMELEQREGEDGNGGEGEGRGSSGACYNFALLNYYADGKDYMGLHSDDETGLVPGSSIASISLGAERDFVFQHKQKEEEGGGGKRRKKTRTRLGHGSLLVMKAPTQSHWKHALPQRMGVSTPRINITFRCVHQHASHAPDHPP